MSRTCKWLNVWDMSFLEDQGDAFDNLFRRLFIFYAT